MTRPVPPVARKQPLRIEQLGRVRVDDYAWMKDDNWQAVLRDPGAIKADVKAHLEAENAYAAAMLAATEPLQAAMFAEMKGRIKEDDSSVPSPDGPFAYFSRYREGGQHPIVCRQRRDGGQGAPVFGRRAVVVEKAAVGGASRGHVPAKPPQDRRQRGVLFRLRPRVLRPANQRLNLALDVRDVHGVTPPAASRCLSTFP